MDPVWTVRGPVARALADLADDATVGVALSGGADSTALADATVAHLGAARVVLLHVDHQLRGPAAAAADLAVVRALAAATGAALEVLPVDVVGPGEAAARRARYAALAGAADARGLAAVLTGHTARDQAETVLMRIVRGTGAAGLAGIAPRRGRYRRPLLGVTRDQIDAYVGARGLAVAHDASNDDPRFFRNRVRHQLLPALRRENPNLDAALCQLARTTRAWRDALAVDAAALLAAADRAGALDAPTLAAAPDAVRALALGRAARAAGLAVAAPHLYALRDLVAGPAAGTRAIDLPGGRAVREYDLVRIEASGGAAPADAPADAPAAAPELVVTCADPCDVRRWRPGDRMRLARLRGRSRKLSDLYGDARVPRRLRAGARVVVRRADQEILWAEHLGPAHGVAITVAPRPDR